MGSIGANVIAGILIEESNLNSWRRIFIIFSFVYVVGGIIYLIFGSAVDQHLNRISSDESSHEQCTRDELQTFPIVDNTTSQNDVDIHIEQ